MDENKNVETQEEIVEDVKDMSNDELKNAISESMNKLRLQAMYLGAQTMCSAVLQKIMVLENKQGKITMNDYKRLVKDIKGFCQVGLSKQVNNDGTVSERTEEETTSTEVEELTEN